MGDLKGEGGGSFICNDTNLRYRHLMLQVAAERPYNLGYWKKEKVWTISASSLSSTKINLQESLFGESGIS